MKTTYTIGTADDGYCLTCWTLGKCIERLFYDVKDREYREIQDYSIWKVKHPENLTLDYWMAGDCYFLDENWNIAENDDELLANGKIIRLKKSDLKFIKKHLPINQ